MLQQAERKLPSAQRDWFYPAVFRVMEENWTRVKGDLDWFVAKFDYRNASADWKNSKDAVSRTMQKLEGIYPADPPYKKDWSSLKKKKDRLSDGLFIYISSM